MNMLPEHFIKIEREYIRNLHEYAGIDINSKKYKFIIQKGGFNNTTEIEFIDVGGVYTYTVNISNDEDPYTVYITVLAKNETECITIFVNNNIASLHNISYDGTCAKEGLERTGAGTKILRFALNLILKYQEKFKINRITLRDHSYIPRKNKERSETLKLAHLRLITEGEPWYASFGFKPYDTTNKKPSLYLLEVMNKNNKILKTLKTKSVNTTKIISKLDSINKKDILNKINANPLMKDFVIVLSENLYKYYDVLIDLFEEIYKPVPDGLLTNFFNIAFYLDI